MYLQSAWKINDHKNAYVEMFRKILNLETGRKQLFSCCGLFSKNSTGNNSKVPQNEGKREVNGKKC